MAMGTGGSGGAMSEINVTPMVDVMLVLLIIFMVTAPLLQQGVAVDLPETKAPTLDVNPDLAVLTITKNHQIFLGDTEISLANLTEKLQANVKLKKDKEIYLHADRGLTYGFVVDVMAILKDSGIENVGMVTDPLSGNKKRR